MQENKSYRDGKYLHIDISGSFYKNGITGVACVSSDDKFHIGTAISTKLKKDLKKQLKVDKNYPQLYAIIIHHLLSKVSLEEYLGVIICNDANYLEVKYHLDRLFSNNSACQKLESSSIDKLRVMFGNRKIISLADNKANSYRKRGLNKLKHQKGIRLNFAPITFKDICQKWKEKL